MDLADRIEIERLIFSYARLVDLARYEDLGRMFAAGRITANQGREPLVGERAVREFYARTNRTHATGTALTHHVITNLEWSEPYPGCVRVDSCFTVFQATPALALQPIVCGRYCDEFERRDGAWRYASKHIEVTLIGDVREHLAIALV